MTLRSAKILVVDDEPDMADSLRLVLERAGHEVLVVTDAARVPATLTEARPDLVITDLRMPEIDGLELVELVRAQHPDLPVIVVTGYASVDTAVEAMKKGVADYLAKPFAPDELLIRVDKTLSYSRLSEENRYLRERAESSSRHREIVGRSPAIAEILRLVDKVAATDARVLLVGESGTGKELVARCIHRASPQREAPFFAVNCGAVGEGLESELFGHERGTFAGGGSARKGIFEVGEGGTLFLDDICDTTAAFQTRLLRALQDGEFLRVGGRRPMKTSVRLISSTNSDPRRSIAEGRLREDLFYRLSVVQIMVPPLRDRAEDIPLLVEHFMATYSQHIKKRVAGMHPDAMAALVAYRWPGNIRELENIIERSIIMADDGKQVGQEELPAELLVAEPRRFGSMQEVRDAERDLLIRTLRECNWNRTMAARRLGIGRRTLYDKLTRLGVSLHPGI